jgi:hypothetical protein
MTYLKHMTLTDGSGNTISKQIDPSKPPFSIAVRGRKAAIDAMCRECIYDKRGLGSCLTQITLCTSWNCPLWDWRPVSDAPISSNAMKGLPEHLIDRDWCSDPENFKTRPYVGSEKKRIDEIAHKAIAA